MSEKLKKTYSFEDINMGLIEAMLIHKDPYYREYIIRNDFIKEKELMFLIENDSDKNIVKLAKEKLEKIIDSKRRRKKRLEAINYFEMDVKGLSIGNEDFEELPSDRKKVIKNYEENENGEILIKGKIHFLFKN